MESKTPIRCKNVLKIPASPFMKRIGYGTGVAVYEFERSPVSNRIRSPWAVKKLLRGKCSNQTEMVNTRLHSEAEVLRKLNHPNVVGFRAFMRDSKGSNVLAMEECSSSLGDLIEQRFENCGDPYPVPIIIKVAYDIAKALDYLHNKVFLLHCDVKSYNILIKDDFKICKLCDFGVCMPLTRDGELDKEKAGVDDYYIGTACWSAPEVLTYPQKISVKADIYSFGLVIWEMLALQPPVDENFEDGSESLVSNLSFDEKNKDKCEPLRLRPNLPDVEFGSEYNAILELYFCCTVVKIKDRPNACALVNILEILVSMNL